jgi:hypothetical protein
MEYIITDAYLAQLKSDGQVLLDEGIRLIYVPYLTNADMELFQKRKPEQDS